MRPAAVAGLLRDCAASGELGPLGAAYADGALLDSSMPGARRVERGPAAIVARLEESLGGPGRLEEWAAAVDPEGVAVWLERVAADGGAVRQRHYLHVDGAEVVRHWVYAARPRTTAAEAPPAGDAAERLFEGLGRVTARTTIASAGWSGNRIDRLTMEDGRSLIAKRIVPGADWIGRGTRDRGREALLFAEGAFARMPPELDPAVVATEREGEAWWVVTRDVAADLLDERTQLTREQNQFILGAAAGMWNEFWDDPPAAAATLEDRLALAAPAVAERERDGVDLLPKQLEAAWAAFAEAVDADVAEPVLELVANPARLASALDDHGATLIHGDLRDENMALTPDRLVLLDWGLGTCGHAVVDLAWYMVHDVWRIDATHDQVVEDFRRALRERDDPRALDLGLISGLVQYGWIFGHSAVVHTDPREREWAREELDWWVPRVRRALDDWR